MKSVKTKSLEDLSVSDKRRAVKSEALSRSIHQVRMCSESERKMGNKSEGYDDDKGDSTE